MTAPRPVLLMTRPQADSVRVVTQLQALGLAFVPVISPLIGITVTGPLPDVSGVRGLIFTSARGVTAWAALGGRMDLPAIAVGDSTAQAARDAGMACDSAAGNADDLVTLIANTHPAAPLLHLHGAHVRGDVAARLTAAGIATGQAQIYDQPEFPPTRAALAALAGKIPVVAPVYSPRTAAILASAPIKAPLLVAALSEAVAKPLLPLHKQDLRIAARPESSAMLSLVVAMLERAAAGKG